MSDKKRLAKAVSIGALISVIAEIILMSLFAVVILTSGLLPTDITNYIMIAATGASVFCGSFISARINKSSGLICGLLTSAVIFIIITAIGLSNSEAMLSFLSLIRLAVMLVLGCAGGILGVNQKEKVFIK